MYDAFYGLSHDPFRLTPDSREVFSHPSYAKARAYLEYGLLRGEGFVLVTGPPGSGKTTLQHDLTRQLPRGTNVAEIVTSRLEPDDLLRMVTDRFGFHAQYRDKASHLETLRHGLESGQSLGERHVLIVDDAQDLPHESLEELRLISNLCRGDTPLLQIILLGQPELRELIRRPGLEQLHQRTIASCRLTPLTAEQSRDYLIHRLRNAQWRGDPAITEATLELLHHAAEGIPRRLNLLATRLFIHGFAEGRHHLTIADVRIALDEMEDEVVSEWRSTADRLEQEEGAEVPAGGDDEVFVAAEDGPQEPTIDPTPDAGEPEIAQEEDVRLDPPLEVPRRQPTRIGDADAGNAPPPEPPVRRGRRLPQVLAVLTALVALGLVVAAVTPIGDWLGSQLAVAAEAAGRVAAEVMNQSAP